MAVTFDTNVLLSATLWDESIAQKLLFDLIRKDIKIYSSSFILNEYKKILRRDFEFSDDDIGELLQKVMAFVILVAPKIKLDVVKDDPDDNPIVECAIESKSKFIISYDKHLLKLKEYQGIRIVKPEEARIII